MPRAPEKCGESGNATINCQREIVMNAIRPRRRKGFRTDTEGRRHSPQHEAYLREVASPATIAVSKTHTLSMFFHAWVIGEATEALNIPISDPIFRFVAGRELAFEYRCPPSQFFSAYSSRAGVPFSLTSYERQPLCAVSRYSNHHERRWHSSRFSTLNPKEPPRIHGVVPEDRTGVSS